MKSKKINFINNSNKKLTLMIVITVMLVGCTSRESKQKENISEQEIEQENENVVGEVFEEKEVKMTSISTEGDITEKHVKVHLPVQNKDEYKIKDETSIISIIEDNDKVKEHYSKQEGGVKQENKEELYNPYSTGNVKEQLKFDPKRVVEGKTQKQWLEELGEEQYKKIAGTIIAPELQPYTTEQDKVVKDMKGVTKK